MNVGGRGVAGDADPGRGERPAGGKNGGLNPGGLSISFVRLSGHTGSQVVDLREVTLEEAFPYQEVGTCVSAKIPL
jgi:hypothetical protein